MQKIYFSIIALIINYTMYSSNPANLNLANPDNSVLELTLPNAVPIINTSHEDNRLKEYTPLFEDSRILDDDDDSRILKNDTDEINSSVQSNDSSKNLNYHNPSIVRPVAHYRNGYNPVNNGYDPFGARAEPIQQNPIIELKDLDEHDMRSIVSLFQHLERKGKTNGLEFTDIFPENHGNLNHKDLIDQVANTYNFLVYKDPRTHKILGVLIFINYFDYKDGQEKTAIQIFIENNNVDKRQTYQLFPKLIEHCKARNCKEISVVPGSDYERFFYQRHGFTRSSQGSWTMKL